jgi:integrase
MILVAAFGGLRSGELRGLQRRDVDLLHGNLTVARARQQLTGLGTQDYDPKSEAGKRTIPMPKTLMDKLSDHMDEYVAPEPTAPVFTRPSGLPLRAADESRAWRDACAEAGVTPWDPKTPEGIRMHDLRHHAATAIAPEATTKELMVFVGHKSPRASLMYQHATAERMSGLADHLDAVIANAKRAPKSAAVRIRP